MSALRIVELGWGTTVQDRGRRGHAALGVPRSGAVDARSHELANRLVGNEPGAAALETNRGLVVEATTATIVSVSSDGARYTLSAGERVRVDARPGEMWAYLAVRGGVVVEPVLGSLSHDTLAGIGPPPLAAGDLLLAGRDPLSEMPADLAPPIDAAGRPRVWPGPQVDWFASLDPLLGVTWTVTADISRVGVRLAARAVTDEEEATVVADGPFGPTRSMPSEGLVEGAIQVTPSGQPIVMLANHPTTGGYPVIAVVEPDDIGIVAQTPPGSTIRFRTA